jgi:hypothetical protein
MAAGAIASPAGWSRRARSPEGAHPHRQRGVVDPAGVARALSRSGQRARALCGGLRRRGDQFVVPPAASGLHLCALGRVGPRAFPLLGEARAHHHPRCEACSNRKAPRRVPRTGARARRSLRLPARAIAAEIRARCGRRGPVLQGARSARRPGRGARAAPSFVVLRSGGRPAGAPSREPRRGASTPGCRRRCTRGIDRLRVLAPARRTADVLLGVRRRVPGRTGREHRGLRVERLVHLRQHRRQRGARQRVGAHRTTGGDP